jgi:hypothetical protein
MGNMFAVLMPHDKAKAAELPDWFTGKVSTANAA